MKAAIPNDDDGVAHRRKLKRRRRAAIRKRKAKLERQDKRQDRKDMERRERKEKKRAILEMRKEPEVLLEVQFRKEMEMPTQLEIEETEREQAWECAEAALAYYNSIQTQEQHFELVDVLIYEERHCAGQLPPDGRNKWTFWHHLNFKAKPTTGVDDPKIFFAELANKSVTACSVISPTEETTITGCGFCPAEGKMQHPAHGVCAGNCTYVPPDHDPNLWEKFRAACKAHGLDRKRNVPI